MKGTVLYVGNLREGGNGRDRIAIIRGAGYAVEGFDTQPYRVAGPALLRSLTARYQIGPAVARLNQDLLAAAARSAFDILFVDKGTILYASVLQRLKSMAHAGLAVHFTPDTAFFYNRSRHFSAAVPEYDLLVTTKPFELSDYTTAGARELLLIHQGFGPRIDPTLSASIPSHLRSEVVFIGRFEDHYIRLLKAAAATVPLSIWGPKWPDYARRHAWAQPVVRGGGLYGPEYAQALAGARIGLGLLSKWFPEVTTTRSFEIPAMGTMLLAERTADHRALFREGHEAEFFDDPEEMVAKLQRYLADEPERARIARAGQVRCMTGGYSLEAQFGRILDWIDRALNTPRPGQTTL